MSEQKTSAEERLRRWRDVGDGEPEYGAGSYDFAKDVIAILADIERLRAALVGAEIAMNRDEDVESARKIIMEANHGKR